MREFDSILAFAEHLVGVEVAVRMAMHHGLDKAAAIIERDAKRQIGVYQQEAGPFNAWPELADSTKADRVAKGFSENQPLLRSGELRDSISREVGMLEAVVGSTSDVMVYQELGTSKIPPRPVIGPAAFKSRHAVERILGLELVRALEYGGGSSYVPLPT